MDCKNKTVDEFKEKSKNLRKNKKYELCKALINQAEICYPESKSVYLEKYYLSKVLKDWQNAVNACEKLIHIDGKSVENYYKKGYALQQLKDFEGARDAFKIYVEMSLGMSMQEVALNIVTKLGLSFLNYNFEFVALGGKNNVGFIKHHFIDEQKTYTLYSKIVPNSKNHNKTTNAEEVFYNQIVHDHRSLQKIIAKSFELLKMKDFSIVTVEEVSGRYPRKKDLKKITENVFFALEPIKISSTKKYNLIYPKKIIPLKKGTIGPVAKKFIQIESKEVNEELFKELKIQHKYSESHEIFIIKKLEEVIMGKKLYEQIIPRRQYNLISGDLKFDNIIIDDKNNRVYLVDWGICKEGPIWKDLAVLYYRSRAPFSIIKKAYLDNKNIQEYQDEIDRVFFLYSLISMYLQAKESSIINRNKDEYIKPAFEAFCELANKI